MKINSTGLKGLVLALYLSLFFTNLSWLELVFCTGLGLTGYFLGLLHDQLPTDDGDGQ